ncbi:hypothetical protein TIFTF001_015400, partial [Ficus carica]
MERSSSLSRARTNPRLRQHEQIFTVSPHICSSPVGDRRHSRSTVIAVGRITKQGVATESSSQIFSHRRKQMWSSPTDPRRHLVIRPCQHHLEVASVSSSL